MASRVTLPPAPPTQGSLLQWATDVHNYLKSQAPVQGEVLPAPVLLAHMMANKLSRAGTSGVLMYDPAAGKPVYAENASWQSFAIPDIVAKYVTDAAVAGIPTLAGAVVVPFNMVELDASPTLSISPLNGHLTLVAGVYHVTASIELAHVSGAATLGNAYIADTSDLTTPISDLTSNVVSVNGTTATLSLKGVVACAIGATYAVVVNANNANSVIGKAYNFGTAKNLNGSLNMTRIK